MNHLRKKTEAVSNITRILCRKSKPVEAVKPQRCLHEDWSNSLELVQAGSKHPRNAIILMRKGVELMESQGKYIGPQCKIALLHEYLAGRYGSAMIDTVNELLEEGVCPPEDLFASILLRTIPPFEPPDVFKKYALRYVTAGYSLENPMFKNAAAQFFCKHHKNPKHAVLMMGNVPPSGFTLLCIAQCFGDFDAASKFLYHELSQRDWGLSKTDSLIRNALLTVASTSSQIDELVCANDMLPANAKAVVISVIRACERLCLFEKGIQVIGDIDHSGFINLEYCTAVASFCLAACKEVNDVFWGTAWSVVPLLRKCCKNPPFLCAVHLAALSEKVKNVDHLEEIYCLFDDLNFRFSPSLRDQLNKAYTAVGKTTPRFTDKSTVIHRSFTS